MKAILKFDLSEPDQRMEHLRCVKATDMAIVLWEIQHNLWREFEDADIPTDEIWFRINGLLEEYGLDMEELIQ